MTQTDFAGNELLNAVLQNLFQFPLNPFDGQIVYRTDLKISFIYSDSKWKPLDVPPLHLEYATINDLLSNQNEQFKGFFYKVSSAYYLYKGISNSLITDYFNVNQKSVLYDQAQSLSEPEKQQARDNIDVYSRPQVKEITGERTNLNTQDKNNLVQAINESNTWTVIEW